MREPSAAVADKAIDHVDEVSATFIAASPFFLLASTAADGTCDVSPRGDPPGSVLLLDERTLAFGDRKATGAWTASATSWLTPTSGCCSSSRAPTTRCA